MRLDFKSLAFGYSLTNGAATPAWETALGQGKGYKLNNKTTINELVKGLIYKSVPPKTISFKKGKGGAFVNGEDDNAGLVISAVFDKVFINDVEIEDGKFILLIVKDDSDSHRGRLKLKYGPDNTYTVGGATIKNSNFISLVQSKFGLSDNACWFVTDASVVDQDVLILRTTIINKDQSVEYNDNRALHAAWDRFYDEVDELEGGSFAPSIPADKKSENIILYGVPGSGKSYYIKNNYCDDEDFMERVVFHPDYTYSDFVGQILPKSEDGNISYPFVPGPFTRIMKKAEADPDKNYYLVIEEINRGNAPAIFGDIFQLLDRENGESEYGINNPEIAKEVYKDEHHPVKIPSNLTLLATMNTADQNVFTLDTAFKRRWSMKCIPNDFENCGYKDTEIGGTDIKWIEFADIVNRMIIQESANSFGNEDKRLGAYFASEEQLGDSALFAEKVLAYLWTDVFKLNHEKLFDSEYVDKPLESLVSDFTTKKEKVFSKLFLDTLNDLRNPSQEIQ